MHAVDLNTPGDAGMPVPTAPDWASSTDQLDHYHAAVTTRTRPPRTVATSVALLVVSYTLPDIVSLIKYGSVRPAGLAEWAGYVIATALTIGLVRSLWLGGPLSRWLALIVMATSLYLTVTHHDEYVWNGLQALWLVELVVKTTFIALLTVPASSRHWFAHVRPGIDETAPSATGQTPGAPPQAPATAAEIQPGQVSER